MGAAVARLGDVAGGAITSASPDVFINGVGVARIGDTVEPHDPFNGPHLGSTLVTGDATVLANGIPICRDGDSASCDHTVSTFSPDVFAS